MMKQRVLDVLNWWLDPERPLDQSLLGDEFVYTEGNIEASKYAFIDMTRLRARLIDVVIHAVVDDEHNTAVFFDATDPVTDLREDRAWLVFGDGNQIHRVHSVRSQQIVAPLTKL